MINHLTINSSYYGKKIVVSLIMNSIDIFDWIAKMSKDSTPLDEIGIFIMSDMLDIHTTVYRRNRLWSTLELKGATENSLIANSDLLLIWVEPGRYCILREKRKDTIKPAHLTGHVTIDPLTNNLVYTPWNLSESEVRTSVDALDSSRVKRELIDPSKDEQETKTIELGHIVDYDQLWELFVDRSPLHSDTETESESDQLERPSDEFNLEDQSQSQLIGATADVPSPEPTTSNQTEAEQETLTDYKKDKDPQCAVDKQLTGATSEISNQELEILRSELEISEDESITGLNKTGGSDETLKGTTVTKTRTLEDALWKESTSEFLIVDDSILNMPDCTLSIKNLSDWEIEIKLDPKPTRSDTSLPVDKDEETEKIQSSDTKEVPDSVHIEENEIPTKEAVVGAKPKIKIGTGKPKKRTRPKVKSSSESDTPRYSMWIKPTPRCLSTGGRTLRSQRAVNYQETYDYRTGRSREKPKNTVPTAALSEPTAARQAAQAAIRDPSLLGTTPTRTIPVLVLHNNAADDSDNTVVYDNLEAEGEDLPPPTPTDPNPSTGNQDDKTTPEETEQPITDTPKPKVRGSLKVKHYVIRRSKKKKKTKKFKCCKCVNRYDSIKTLN